MRRRLFLTALLLTALPLAAQEDQPPTMLDSARRAQLEERIEQRVEEWLRRDLDLTDEQVVKLRATHQKFGPRRREVVQRQRDLRVALGDQMRPGIAADPDSVRRLNDALVENRARIFQLEQDQAREMEAYLSPVQVARYWMIRERVRERVGDVRRNWGRDRSGPGARSPPEIWTAANMRQGHQRYMRRNPNLLWVAVNRKSAVSAHFLCHFWRQSASKPVTKFASFKSDNAGLSKRCFSTTRYASLRNIGFIFPLLEDSPCSLTGSVGS